MLFHPVSRVHGPHSLRGTSHSSQFSLTIPHIIYACLGGFVVLVSLRAFLLIPSGVNLLNFQFGMFSLFIREKVSVSLYPLTTAHSSTALYRRSLLGIPLWCSHWYGFLHIPRSFYPPYLNGRDAGPYGAGIFDPRGWANHNEDVTNTITLEFTRVVLAIGVFAIGVELPKAYVARHWKSLFFLLFPVMTWVGLMFSKSVRFHLLNQDRGGLFLPD